MSLARRLLLSWSSLPSLDLASLDLASLDLLFDDPHFLSLLLPLLLLLPSSVWVLLRLVPLALSFDLLPLPFDISSTHSSSSSVGALEGDKLGARVGSGSKNLLSCIGGVGSSVGTSVGEFVGDTVGLEVGLDRYCGSRGWTGRVGLVVGLEVGENVGLDVGVDVGEKVGLCVGVAVGLKLGLDVGFSVGENVGLRVGAAVGGNDGLDVGFFVGENVG